MKVVSDTHSIHGILWNSVKMFLLMEICLIPIAVIIGAINHPHHTAAVSGFATMLSLGLSVFLLESQIFSSRNRRRAVPVYTRSITAFFCLVYGNYMLFMAWLYLTMRFADGINADPGSVVAPAGLYFGLVGFLGIVAVGLLSLLMYLLRRERH